MILPFFWLVKGVFDCFVVNFMKSYVKMLIFHIFCHKILVFKEKKFFIIFSLLFFAGMVKYICKSVVQTTIFETAHHFPPYHIGKRPGTLRSRAFILNLTFNAVRCLFAHLEDNSAHSL